MRALEKAVMSTIELRKNSPLRLIASASEDEC